MSVVHLTFAMLQKRNKKYFLWCVLPQRDHNIKKKNITRTIQSLDHRVVSENRGELFTHVDKINNESQKNMVRKTVFQSLESENRGEFFSHVHKINIEAQKKMIKKILENGMVCPKFIYNTVM